MPKPSKVEIQHISPQGHSTECTHCTNVYKCPKCTIHCQTRIVTTITINTDNVCGSCWVRELIEARSAKVGFGGSGGWRGEFGTIWRISIFTLNFFRNLKWYVRPEEEVGQNPNSRWNGGADIINKISVWRQETTCNYGYHSFIGHFPFFSKLSCHCHSCLTTLNA